MANSVRRKPNAAEKYRATVSAAMPEVKRLVKKYGRKAISNCVGKIRDYDKEVVRLAALKKEIAAREAKLR
jgi:hypothetical protein